MVESHVPSDANLIVSRIGSGSYDVTVSGLGTAYCPLPTLTVMGANTYMWTIGGGCGTGMLTTTIRTGDGLDHDFFLVVNGGTALVGAAGLRASADGLTPLP